MTGIGIFVAVRPDQFAKFILIFISKSWFHTFEIWSRLVLGIVFIAFAALRDSLLLLVIGLLCCFAAVFLIRMGPHKHRDFGVLLSKLGGKLRILGYVAIVLGGAITFAGIS